MKTRSNVLVMAFLIMAVLLTAAIVMMLVGAPDDYGWEARPPDPPAALALATDVPLTMPPTWTPTLQLTPSITPTSRLPRVVAQAPVVTPVASLTPWKVERAIVIGESVQQRPITVYRFGQGKHERMIVAGIHGADEINTVGLARALIDYINLHPEVIPADVSLYVLPALNADSAARGAVEGERLNARGVDLNRNFPTNWKADWHSQGCSSLPGTAGPKPGSEPETQALMQFILSRKIEALISYHSALLGIFPSGDPADAGSVRLAQAIAGLTPYAYPPYQTGCEYTGTLVDWAAAVGVPAAVDVELNSATEIEFETNLKVLDLLLAFEK